MTSNKTNTTGKYLLSIDQGTTSSRAILFTTDGDVAHIAQQEFTQYYPANGWIEHDAEEIWQSVRSTCQQVMQEHGISPEQIISIGICNQRETTIVWHKKTGKPVYNAIVWQDRRTADYCQSLSVQGHDSTIAHKTGLLIDSYFSATKVRWILNNVEGARQQAENGELLFGTVDTYLLWRLTGGKSHFTDATNASRTMIYNIENQCWDDELLTLFDIPTQILPKVLDSAADFGETTTELFGAAIPIQGIAGDQQAALFGQACFTPGMAKSTYGTGCFLMVNTGELILKSHNKLLTTIAYQLNGKAYYALEGSIFVAGAAIQWIRDGIELIKSAPQTQALAEEADIEHGVYFVPAFTGLGAPYWDSDARGAITGLTRATGIKEIVSAALQSICFQTRDLTDAIAKDGIDIHNMRVDGGMAANDWFVRFLTDTLAIDIDRPKSIETSALGVAFLAGLQAGVYESIDHIQALWQSNSSHKPQMDAELRQRLYQGWQQAVGKVLTK